MRHVFLCVIHRNAAFLCIIHRNDACLMRHVSFGCIFVCVIQHETYIIRMHNTTWCVINTNDACPMLYHTYEWCMSHAVSCVSHIASSIRLMHFSCCILHTNNVCLMLYPLAYIQMMHVSCPTKCSTHFTEWATAHIHERVKSRIRMGHSTHTRRSHVTHTNESCRMANEMQPSLHRLTRGTHTRNVSCHAYK